MTDRLTVHDTINLQAIIIKATKARPAPTPINTVPSGRLDFCMYGAFEVGGTVWVGYTIVEEEEVEDEVEDKVGREESDEPEDEAAAELAAELVIEGRSLDEAAALSVVEAAAVASVVVAAASVSEVAAAVSVVVSAITEVRRLDIRRAANRWPSRRDIRRRMVGISAEMNESVIVLCMRSSRPCVQEDRGCTLNTEMRAQ